MELDGLGAQGLLRSATGCLMVGDTTETDRGAGVVEGIHEDRSVSVRLAKGGVHRCLHRDCRLLEAARVVAPRTEMRTRAVPGALDWQGHTVVYYNRTREKRVCSAIIAPSEEATSIEILRGTLTVEGQDQGWGDTGFAGVQLRLRYQHEDDSFDEFTAVKITYDHNRNRAGRHHVNFNAGLGLKSSSPIAVELLVFTPSFPGWSAHASKVKLSVEVEETLSVTDPLEAWSSIRLMDTACIGRLWRRCGSLPGAGSTPAGKGDRAEPEGGLPWLEGPPEDAGWLGHLEIDLSHLSNSGLERQGVTSASAAASLAEQQTDRTTVARRILAELGGLPELSTSHRRNIGKVARVLGNAEQVQNGPSEDNDRRAACDELLAMISCILDGLRQRADMAGFAATSLAEAAAHCWTAWEEAVHIAYHVVCPGASAPSNAVTTEVEDWLLGELLALRRDLAYRALAKAKAAAGETDVHFKNFFFSSIHFGLPMLQRMASRDPSRLNYTMLNLVNMDDVRAGIWQEYTPAAVVAHTRALLDASAYWRGRVVDWLRARCLPGLGAEEWLYTWCHTPDYGVRDEALVFMLASMRILRADTLCEIRPATVPRRSRTSAPSGSAQGAAPGAEGHRAAPAAGEDRRGRCVQM